MHTKEPWKINNYGTVLAEGHTLLVTGMALNTGRSDPLAEANSRRIVACVNACAGLRTEDLESVSGLGFPAQKLIEQRDELLAVAKEVLYSGNEGDWQTARRILMEAIAKADLTQ